MSAAPLSPPLAALRDELRKGPAGTQQLMFRLQLSRAAFDSRLRRLKAHGYLIESVRRGNRHAVHTLVAEPGRTCAEPGCETILRRDRVAAGKRYCSLHEPQSEPIDALIGALERDVAGVTR